MPDFDKIPREFNKKEDIHKLEIQDLKKGALFDYKLQTWRVIKQTQYDWEQGNTDILYRINNTKNRSILLLIAQNLAIYEAWIEKKLTFQEITSYTEHYDLRGIEYDSPLEVIFKNNPPLELTFKNELFLKETIEIGHEFTDNWNYATRVKQDKYFSKDRKKSLRVLHYKNTDVFMYSGTKVENFEFSNILIS